MQGKRKKYRLSKGTNKLGFKGCNASGQTAMRTSIGKERVKKAVNYTMPKICGKTKQHRDVQSDATVVEHERRDIAFTDCFQVRRKKSIRKNR